MLTTRGFCGVTVEVLLADWKGPVTSELDPPPSSLSGSFTSLLVIRLTYHPIHGYTLCLLRSFLKHSASAVQATSMADASPMFDM